jgi:hypothetical protein
VVTGSMTLPPNSYVPVTYQVLAGPGLSGGGALSGSSITLSAPVMAASGAAHRAGIAPDPGAAAGSTRYLREDATWATVSVGSIGAVPTTRQILTGPGLSGGGDLSQDRTISGVVFGASGISHAVGIVPDPGGTAGATRYLREDASWAAVVAVVADDTSTQRVQAALAGALVAARHQFNFVAGPGTSLNVVDNPGSNRVDITLTLTGTGPATPSVYAVDGTVIGTQSELNLISGTGAALSGVNNTGAGRVDITVAATGGVSSVFTRTGAVVAVAGDYAAFYVPVARRVIAGAGMSGGGALSADVTLNANVTNVFGRTGAVVMTTAEVMGASGAAHALGIVPDPGATAGATRYLREDASWAVPPGGAGAQSPWTSNIDAAAFELHNVSKVGIGTATPYATLAAITPGPGPTGTTTPSLTHQSAANFAFALAGWTELAVFNTSSSSNAVVLQTRHQTADGLDFPISLNPLGGNVGIGNQLLALPSPDTTYTHLVVGPTAIGTPIGAVTVVGNTTTTSGTAVGAFQFANYNIAGTDKRIAIILAVTDGALNSGCMSFYTYLTGTLGERMRITSAGNVGIGTTSPQCAMDILSGGLRVQNTTVITSGVGLELLYQANVGRVFAWNRNTGTGQDLAVGGAGDGTGLWIKASGNVGIGTTSPGAPLEIATNAYPMLRLNSANPDVAIQLTNSGTGGHEYRIESTSGASGYGQGAFAIVDDTAGPARLLISSAGNVGIGTTSPAQKLEVNGAALLDGGGPLYLLDTNNGIKGVSGQGLVLFAYQVPNALCVTAGSGNVGIGTTTPNAKFVIAGPGSAAPPSDSDAMGGTLLVSDTAGYGGEIRLGGPWGKGYHASIRSIPSDSSNNQAGSLVFYNRAVSTNTALTEVMRLTPAGYVGIGQANPASTLDVNGNIHASGNVNASGDVNVGIGSGGGPGDLSLGRPSAPTTAAIYFGNTGQYIYYDGTRYNFTNTVYVAGNCNITGQYQVNGTPIATGGGGITVQSVATGSRGFGTVYQNTTGKPMFIAITVTGSGGTGMSCFTDSTTNPSTSVAAASNINATGANVFCSFWVLPSNYYKVTGSSALNYWIEWW